MTAAPQLLLIGGVVAVGVLHTVVPDHWLPIAILARQQGWSRGETAWAAARAGFGHVMSTVLLGLAVWFGGAALARRFGATIDLASSAALVAFGAWVAVSAWRELPGRQARRHGHAHRHHHDHRHGHHRHDDDEPEWIADPLYAAAGAGVAVALRHRHIHRHGGGLPHVHWHDHEGGTEHDIAAAGEPPLHRHRHRMPGRGALVLILGSSPMVEGIPVFFAAGSYGGGLIGPMAVAFAASTIATYVVLCVGSTASLQRMNLARLERYGEVLSGGLIAAIGLAFGIAATV